MDPTTEYEPTSLFTQSVVAYQSFTPSATPQSPTHDSFRRSVRERCCNRYFKYLHVFVFVMFLLSAIGFGIIQYAHPRQHVEFYIIYVLFVVGDVYALAIICKFLYKCCMGQDCIVCRWCGCFWIERHQLLYEERNGITV
jgi:hypothetical protein